MMDEDEEEPDVWSEDFLARLGVTRAQMQHHADIRELFEAEVSKERARFVLVDLNTNLGEAHKILDRMAKLREHECFRYPWIARPPRKVPMPEEEGT
jgi:hypothetical protein